MSHHDHPAGPGLMRRSSAAAAHHDFVEMLDVGQGHPPRNGMENANMNAPRNPYGKRPGGGITLPDYFRPTPSCTSNNFAPPNEPLAAGEMRICFTGSTVDEIGPGHDAVSLGQGKGLASACEAIGRNPGAVGPIRITMIIGLALIESLVIYALVIAFLLLP